jgi:hypothetical protein
MHMALIFHCCITASPISKGYLLAASWQVVSLSGKAMWDPVKAFGVAAGLSRRVDGTRYQGLQAPYLLGVHSSLFPSYIFLCLILLSSQSLSLRTEHPLCWRLLDILNRFPWSIPVTVFFKSALLRYNLHDPKFTECTIQCVSKFTAVQTSPQTNFKTFPSPPRGSLCLFLLLVLGNH